VIQDRGYVRLEDKRFFAEDIGEVVTDILTEHFPDVVDVGFTSHMEEELDDIAEGKLGWTQVLDEFYGPFERALEKAGDQIKPPVVDTEMSCPRCPQEGREPGMLQIKLGRFGKFLACSNYPECTYTAEVDGTPRPEPEATGETCPQCAEEGREPVGNLVKKTGRFGPFVGCDRYPDCKFIKKEPAERVSTNLTCPQCGQGEIIQRRGRFGLFYSCERYPDCDFAVNQLPVDRCPECDGLRVEARGNAIRCIACNRAWRDGEELEPEEAEKLVPKPRAKKPAAKKAPAKKKAAAKKKAPAKKQADAG
jgi:DNA topoisomerase-1